MCAFTKQYSGSCDACCELVSKLRAQLMMWMFHVWYLQSPSAQRFFVNLLNEFWLPVMTQKCGRCRQKNEPIIARVCLRQVISWPTTWREIFKRITNLLLPIHGIRRQGKKRFTFRLQNAIVATNLWYLEWYFHVAVFIWQEFTHTW